MRHACVDQGQKGQGELVKVLGCEAMKDCMQGLLPAQVRLAVQNRQGWAYVPAETVQPGNLTVVLPGDCVPVDGTVVEGASSLNESALTGEPMPVTVSAGAAC